MEIIGEIALTFKKQHNGLLLLNSPAVSVNKLYRHILIVLITIGNVEKTIQRHLKITPMAADIF